MKKKTEKFQDMTVVVKPGKLVCMQDHAAEETNKLKREITGTKIACPWLEEMEIPCWFPLHCNNIISKQFLPQWDWEGFLPRHDITLIFFWISSYMYMYATKYTRRWISWISLIQRTYP